MRAYSTAVTPMLEAPDAAAGKFPEATGAAGVAAVAWLGALNVTKSAVVTSKRAPPWAV
jgi:hypothetical protein